MNYGLNGTYETGDSNRPKLLMWGFTK